MVEAVSRCVYFAAPEAIELRSHYHVVRVKQRMPVPVANLRRPARRVHDVGEQHGGEHPVIGHVGLLAGEELGDLLKGRTPSGSTKWYTLRPGSSTYFAPNMRSATSLPHSAG